MHNMNHRIMKYNPAFLCEEALVASFCVRLADFQLVMDTIRENTDEVNQHVLVVAPRGMGKTMLVLRAAAELRRDEELAAQWYPLVFAEESYEVSTPGEFWLEALFHLGQQTKDPDWKRTYEELRGEVDEDRLRDRALGQLLDFADAQGKRIMLVVENLNMLLGEQLSEDDAWKLRHTLHHEKRIMLLASTTSRFEEFENAGKAMFELFRTVCLKPLSVEECRAMWGALTGLDYSDRRIRPIQILTGGSPRLLSIISSFAASESFENLMQDLTHLVDEHTEYFKSHIDALAATERKVYLALADLWAPGTAREVGQAARLDSSKTSALLNRLVQRGAVVVVDDKPRAKTYQVAERLYNIYYLMRRRGTPSSRVRAIVKFMIDFYDEEKLVRTTCCIFDEIRKKGLDSCSDHYAACEALLQSTPDQTRRAILEALPSELLDAPQVPNDLRQLIQGQLKDLEETSPTLPQGAADLVARAKAFKKAGDSRAALDMLRQALQTEEWNRLVPLALTEIAFESHEHHEEILSMIREAVAQKPKNCIAWSCLASVLNCTTKCYEEAEEAYRQALENAPKYAWAWAHLGKLLHEKLGRYNEAEKAYRQALEIAPEYVWVSASLGQLLHEKLERYEEAEQVYRKALEIEPKHAWVWAHLGYLFHKRLERYEEAEQAYRQAIEIKPKYAWAWVHLGRLLEEDLKRVVEAEDAYQKAAKLFPDQSWGWAFLVRFLVQQGGRLDEVFTIAEAFLPTHSEDVTLRNQLAWTFFEKGVMEHMEQAEQWASEAVANAPENNVLKHTYACVLCANGKGEEALVPAAAYFGDVELVGKGIDDSVDLAAALVTAGVAREAVELIENSASAALLEPLVVALHLILGDEVKSAVEIVEVAKDVAQRIEEFKLKRLSA